MESSETLPDLRIFRRALFSTLYALPNLREALNRQASAYVAGNTDFQDFRTAILAVQNPRVDEDDQVRVAILQAVSASLRM